MAGNTAEKSALAHLPSSRSAGATHASPSAANSDRSSGTTSASPFFFVAGSTGHCPQPRHHSYRKTPKSKTTIDSGRVTRERVRGGNAPARAR